MLLDQALTTHKATTGLTLTPNQSRPLSPDNHAQSLSPLVIPPSRATLQVLSPVLPAQLLSTTQSLLLDTVLSTAPPSTTLETHGVPAGVTKVTSELDNPPAQVFAVSTNTLPIQMSNHEQTINQATNTLSLRLSLD